MSQANMVTPGTQSSLETEEAGTLHKCFLRKRPRLWSLGQLLQCQSHCGSHRDRELWPGSCAPRSTALREHHPWAEHPSLLFAMHFRAPWSTWSQLWNGNQCSSLCPPSHHKASQPVVTAGRSLQEQNDTLWGLEGSPRLSELTLSPVSPMGIRADRMMVLSPKPGPDPLFRKLDMGRQFDTQHSDTPAGDPSVFTIQLGCRA